ncbi:MAG: hypothetical protein EA413_10040 [Cyanobium sp. PLM2.Bin73]|nr:MAG: hypothetical protein EA413_10040 [Cyanobium sp. PLM2.Bin73]
MVGRVLTGNGITRYGDGQYSLIGAEELSDSERDALLQLCRQRLDGFREQRGEEVFAHRSPPPQPDQRLGEVPGAHQGTGPLRVLRRQAVGEQTPHQRALEVAPIIPRNQGGSDDISNLQALCFRWKAGKRWRGTTRSAKPTNATRRGWWLDTAGTGHRKITPTPGTSRSSPTGTGRAGTSARTAACGS